MKLSIRGMAMALGVIEAFGFLVFGLLAGVLGWGTELVDLMSQIFIGFGVGPAGLAIGVLWGFVKGFVFGAILASVYNHFI